MTDYFSGADTIIFVGEHYVFFARSLAVMLFFFFCFLLSMYFFVLQDRSIHQYFVPLGMGQSEFYVLYLSRLYNYNFSGREIGLWGGGRGGGGGWGIPGLHETLSIEIQFGRGNLGGVEQ